MKTKGKQRLKFGRYDYAAWTTFAAYACASLAVPLVLVQMAGDLDFPLDKGGMSTGGVMQMVRSLAMCLSMAVAGFAAAKWGNRRSIGVSLCLMGAGILLAAFAKSWQAVVPMLLVAGLGEGVIEGLGTPFVQDLHDEEPGRYVNFAHGFWSLGIFGFVIAGGLLLHAGASWRIILALVAAITLLPVLLVFLPSRKPYVEKSIGKPTASVVKSAVEILRRGKFWYFFAAMVFAGGGEYCLTFWCASFIQLNFAASALAGAAGTAFFSAGMFLGRTTFGALVGQRHLKTLIVAVGVFGVAVSLLIPPFAQHLGAFPAWAILPTLFLLLFLSGIGSAPFWPSIQSLAVDRMPEIDSTMAFIILSCAGVPGCGIFTWLMGVVGDHAGLDTSFYLVPLCYVTMVLLVLAGDRRK